jgi:hypothetical protein
MMYPRLNPRGPSCHQTTVAVLCLVQAENSKGLFLYLVHPVPLRGIGIAVIQVFLPVIELMSNPSPMTMNVLSLSWFEYRVHARVEHPVTSVLL